MKVMVTGGTGFVGSNTVAELINNGHKVRLLVRSKHKITPAFQPLGVKIDDVVVGDVLDPDSIARAAEGCDATVHCGSVYSLDPRMSKIINDTNVKGTFNVLTIANQFKHDPIIHVSSFVALLGDRGCVLSPNSMPTNPPGSYFKSKADSDRIARQLQEDGIPIVITYPGSVWGPHDPHFGESCQIAKNILTGKWRISVEGVLPISDVRDFAKLHVSLLEKGCGPRRYFAPVRNITTKELFSTFSEITGRRFNTLALPGWSLLLPMRILDTFQRFVPFRFPYNFQAVYCASLAQAGDDTNTEGEFNIKPRPLDETIADQIHWMAQSEYIQHTFLNRSVS